MRVSVVVTSYNQRNYLIEAIESLLNQALLPHEIIICDDCSSKDDSREVILGYASRYPHLILPILQDKNIGVAANRNAGLRAACGDYVTTLDGDDHFLPEKIKREVDIATINNAPIVYSNVYYINQKGQRTGVRYHTGQQIQGCVFEAVATMKFAPPRELLIARACFDAIGYQNEKLSIYEDWEYAVRLTSQFLLAACRKPLIEHRRHSDGLHNAARSTHLMTMISIVQDALNGCAKSIVVDKHKTERSLRAFLHLLQAKDYALQGKLSAAMPLVRSSIMLNPWRGNAYDLLMRLMFPRLFVREARLYDHIRIGPLAVPYYLVRGMIERSERKNGSSG